MYPIINIHEALAMPNACFFDLRSPKEFADGSIPGAKNVPIFDNEERAEIGTIYKQISEETAKARGLEIASAKLPSIIQIIKATAGKRNVVVYCWRGGMRSQSIATILHLMGIPVYQLNDGYKAYRQYILNTLLHYKIRPCFVVLHGLTGVGKTLLLRELVARGQAVLDLEGLANHRGSVFGKIGKGQVVTAKNFDAMLLEVLDAYKKEEYIIVEAESKRIGNVYLPDCVMQSMKQGKHILLSASLQTRVQRILDEYLCKGTEACVHEDIFQALDMLESRLGKVKSAQLKEMLQRKNYRTFVEILLLEYYDPLYNYSVQDVQKFDFHVSAENIYEAADRILKFLYGGGKESHE